MAMGSTTTLRAVIAIAVALTCCPPAAFAADAGPADIAPAALAQANAFSDVPEAHWARAAIERLSADGYVVGYPDGTFKGARPMTRYEAALIVYRAATAIETKLTAREHVDEADIAIIKKLIDEFGSELRLVERRVAALEAQTSTLSSQTAALKDQVSKDALAVAALQKNAAASKLGYSFWNRPGTFTQQLSAMSGGFAGSALGSVSGGTNQTGIGTQTLVTGANGTVARAVDYSAFRINLSGSVDPRIAYAARIESAYRAAVPTSGQSTTTPGYCTSATPPAGNCGVQDYGGTIGNFPLRLQYAWVGYFSPGGFYTKIGRIGQDEGRDIMAIALGGDNEQGLQVGFRNSRVDAWIMPITQGTSAYNAALLAAAPATANVCPPGNPLGAGCISASTHATDGIAGRAEYYVPSTRSAFGVTYDGYNNELYTGWNPYAGLCVAKVGAAATSTTPGAGGTTWNTTPALNQCAAGTVPLVYAAGNSAGVAAGQPVTGAYQTIQASIKAPSVYYVQYFGSSKTPTSRITAELLWRVGNDPFSAANPATGALASWKDNRALGLEYAYASKGNFNGGPLYPSPGLRNSNVFVAQYYNQGLNAQSQDGGQTGVINYESFYYGNMSGMQQLGLHFDHWFTDNFRAGLSYIMFSNRNVNIPAGSTTCPACSYSVVSHALSLDTYLAF